MPPAAPYIFALFYAAIWSLHRIWDTTAIYVLQIDHSSQING